jgi:hypothetical protein
MIENSQDLTTAHPTYLEMLVVARTTAEALLQTTKIKPLSLISKAPMRCFVISGLCREAGRQGDVVYALS